MLNSSGFPCPRPGIWSTGDLNMGAEVARVPWKLLITRATAREALDIPRDLAQDWESLGVTVGVPGSDGKLPGFDASA